MVFIHKKRVRFPYPLPFVGSNPTRGTILGNMLIFFTILAILAAPIIMFIVGMYCILVVLLLFVVWCEALSLITFGKLKNKLENGKNWAIDKAMDLDQWVKNKGL